MRYIFTNLTKKSVSRFALAIAIVCLLGTNNGSLLSAQEITREIIPSGRALPDTIPADDFIYVGPVEKSDSETLSTETFDVPEVVPEPKFDPQSASHNGEEGTDGIDGITEMPTVAGTDNKNNFEGLDNEAPTKPISIPPEDGVDFSPEQSVAIAPEDTPLINPNEEPGESPVGVPGPDGIISVNPNDSPPPKGLVNETSPSGDGPVLGPGEYPNTSPDGAIPPQYLIDPEPTAGIDSEPSGGVDSEPTGVIVEGPQQPIIDPIPSYVDDGRFVLGDGNSGFNRDVFVEEPEQQETPKVEGTVASVEPQPTPALDDKVVVIDSLNGQRYIQIAGYREPDLARKKVIDLIDSGNIKTDNKKVLIYKDRNSIYYRVVLGPFNNSEIGLQMYSVRKLGYEDAFIVK